MKIKYIHIDEAEYCCKEMKYQQEEHKIYRNCNDEVWLDVYTENKDWINEKMNFCPFCGEKIDVISWK